MKDNEVKKRKGNILFSLLALMAIGYIAYQGMALSRPDYTTETALFKTVTDEITASGWFFRKEKAVSMPKSAGSYVRYEVEDCGRVAADGVVATVYELESDAAASGEMAALEAAIVRLDAMLSRPGVGVGEISDIDGRVYGQLTATTSAAARGELINSGQAKEEIVYLLTRRQLATGGLDSTQSLRDSLEARRAELAAQLRGKGSRVKATSAGCFVSMADGYEDILDPQLCGTLTAARLRELVSTPPAATQGTLGRVIEDYEWRYVCIVSEEEAKTLKEGGSYKLRFGSQSDTPVPATLDSLYGSQDGYVLTFRSGRQLDCCMTQRQQTVGIIRSSYEGLAVNNEARRVVDGVTGVYVLTGLEMVFKPIEALYSNESYTIVKWNSSKSGALKLYDEIIITGREIYDGKIVN